MNSRPDPLLTPEPEPSSDGFPRSSTARSDVVRLVRDRRYEEALSLLYQALADAPGDRELQASIRQIKQFLVGAYAKRLGGLDHVAGPVPPSSVRSPDAILASRYIDGFATFGDISQTCPLGQLRTLQVLVSLYCSDEPTPPPASAASLRQRDVMPLPELSAPDSVIEPPPPTLPTGSIPPARWTPPPVEESLQDRIFRETFALGTTAYVQRKYDDALEAFQECDRLRPGDEATATMLRRTIRDRRS